LLTAPELQAALARVVTPGASTTPVQIFAFLGAKGGVGTTTIGVNVATALAQFQTGSTLLIDLHLAYGDAAIFLGAEPRFSVLDALDNVHRLDRAFFRGLVSHTRGGLDFLGSSDRASSRPVDAGAVRTLIETASRHYRYVVLDVPRSDGVMLDVLEPSSRIIIVANQELATVRAATRVAATLRQRYGKDRVAVVVSRFDKLANISEDDVERVLGSRVAHTFPSNYRLALDALNAGRPVVLDNHNKLAAALTGFARSLVDTSTDAPSEPRSGGFLGRLTGKR
jgi:pilus assembly protein CpaE